MDNLLSVLVDVHCFWMLAMMIVYSLRVLGLCFHASISCGHVIIPEGESDLLDDMMI